MKIVEAPIPICAGDEVLIQVKAAGICGTDIGDYVYMKGFEGIPGHEVSGVVEDPGNSQFRRGDRVMLSVHITCRACDDCRNGDVVFCPELKVFGAGMGIDGGMAEYIKVPAQVVHPLPDDIPFETGCLILDALATAYGAVNKFEIREGMRVAVLGAGPIGLLAMLIASSRGANVIAIEASAARLEAVQRYGAKYAIDLNECDALERVRTLTDGRGVDAVFQCATSASAVRTGLSILANRGTMVQVSGVHEVTLDMYNMLNEHELILKGTRNGNELLLPELIRFVREHPQVNEIITNRYPLSEAKEAFESAKAHVGIKTVLLP